MTILPSLEDRVGKRRAVRIRRALVAALAAGAGAGTAVPADLEAAWDAQLRGRLPQAQMLLEAGDPASPEHRLALAGVALELGDLDRAQAALEPLAGDAGHPDYPRAALLLGRLHLAAGRDGAARRALFASLERSAGGPYAAAAYLALIRLDLHAGAVEDAGERFRLLAEMGPSPELEIAAGLLSPSGRPGPVRPFPSPIGLFAAARLSEGAEAPPLPAGAGPRPITPAGLSPTAGPADTPQAAPSTAPASGRRGLQQADAADAAADTAPRFTVRLGSFRDVVNSQRMVTALKDAGFPARSRPYGDYHRVLAGATATRQAAESLLSRLRTIGYDGDVIPYPPDADR